MQVYPGVAGQPGVDLGVLVGGVVVADYVQLHPGIGLGDPLEEGKEFGVPVARLTRVDDLVGSDL